MYYVYALISELDGKFYIGHTSDVEKRLKMHNAGYVVATKHRRPLKLFGTKAFRTKQEATKKEYWLKRQKDIEAAFRMFGKSRARSSVG
ncbi:MAG: GIY-YIG nuclease family protein [Proteobacteria bacterium]|nr:GIY-YIG nuclease family protein [Pseudomonadota bacterium]